MSYRCLRGGEQGAGSREQGAGSKERTAQPFGRSQGGGGGFRSPLPAPCSPSTPLPTARLSHDYMA
jgi:hypothetical protein